MYLTCPCFLCWCLWTFVEPEFLHSELGCICRLPGAVKRPSALLGKWSQQVGLPSCAAFLGMWILSGRPVPREHLCSTCSLSQAFDLGLPGLRFEGSPTMHLCVMCSWAFHLVAAVSLHEGNHIKNFLHVSTCLQKPCFYMNLGKKTLSFLLWSYGISYTSFVCLCCFFPESFGKDQRESSGTCLSSLLSLVTSKLVLIYSCFISFT